jgi:hypothetical protein
MNPTNEERLWAALSHALVLAGAQFLAPLIIYLVKKDRSAFITDHARESLNFQISILIYGAVLGAAFFTIILIPLVYLGAFALPLFDLVMVIVATIKAASGETWRYPLCLRLVK